MNQSKVAQLLNYLSLDEFKRLYKFIQSPFYNTNPSLIKLYQVLKKEYPNFDTPKLEKERVFKKLYPNKPFSYHHFANLLAEMARLIEEFLIQLEIEQEAFQKQKTLIKAYKRRNAYLLFEKKTKSLIQTLNALPYRDSSYYREVMDLKSDYFFHPLTERYTLQEDGPKEVVDLLDHYFVLSKMQLAGELKNREKILAVDYEIKMLSTSLKFINQELAETNPLFSIYANILQFHEQADNKELFFLTKELFEQHIKTIRPAEQKDILQNMLNYCIRKINEGQFEYNKEIFSLYKVGLEYDLLLEGYHIREGTFVNIVGVASVLEEFEWAETFIQQYNLFLKDSIRPFVQALSIGELKFRQKEYDEVIDLLIPQRFTLILHEINARFLLIKTWFEKFLKDESYYSILVTQMKAFEKYLKRMKLVAIKKAEGYLNFLRVLKRIIDYKAKLKISLAHKKDLLKFSNHTQHLIGRVWLNQKIEAL